MRTAQQPLSELDFWHGWDLLCKVWRENGHCLRLGCGRDTIMYWVVETCNEWNTAGFYRAVLMEATRRRFATKTQTCFGYSQFFLDITL